MDMYLFIKYELCLVKFGADLNAMNNNIQMKIDLINMSFIVRV